MKGPYQKRISFAFLLLCNSLTLFGAFLSDYSTELDPIETENQFYEYKLRYENMDSTTAIEDLPHLLRLFEASKKLKLDSLSFQYGYDLGDIYYSLDSLPLAFKYTHEAYYYNKSVKDQNEVGHLTNFLGLINSIMGNYETALGYYFESIEIFKSNDKRMMAYALGNISEVYYTLKDVDRAMEYSLEASRYSQELEGEDYFYNYGFDCIRLADWNLQKGQIDSAAYYLNLSLSLADSLEDEYEYIREFKFYIHENATMHFLTLNDLDVASYHLKRAESYKLVFLEGNYTLLRGEYLYVTDQKEALFQLIEEVDPQKIDTDLVEDWMRLEIKALEKYGLYDQLGLKYKALEKLVETKYSEQRNHFTVIANARYESLQKEEQIGLLQKQNELDRAELGNYRVRLIAIGLLLFSVLSGLGFLGFYYRKKNQYSLMLEKEVARQTNFLQKLNTNLSTKNEELKQFNYIIAHDLKEPVRSIVSFSELLKLFKADPTKVNEYCDMIINSGKQLHTLVNDIQEFQTLDIEETELENFDVSSLISDVQNSLSSFLKEKNATIIYNDLPVIKSSKSMLFVVFKNLIENGLKYNISQHPQVQITAKQVGPKWYFNFKDNGIGVSSQYFEEIFIMFKRLHNRSMFTGTGIGLALSQKIAKRLNGEISITSSEEGVGSEFQFAIEI